MKNLRACVENYIKTLGKFLEKYEWVRILFYMFALISYFRPFMMDRYAPQAYRVLQYGSWLAVGVMTLTLLSAWIVYKCKFPVRLVIGICMLRLFYSISTFIMGNNGMDKMKEYVKYTILLLFIAYLLQKDRQVILRAVMVVFGTYLLLDLCTMMISPNGIYFTDPKEGIPFCYFSGSRNGSILYVLLFIIALMKYEWPKKTLRYVMMALSTALILSTQIIGRGVAGLIATICLVIGMLVYVWNPKFLHVRAEWVMLLYFVCSCLLIFGNITEAFGPFIEKVLHRDVTLNSRTIIWGMVIPHIKERWFFGYGSESNDIIAQRMWLMGPHNTILGALYVSGIWGLLAYLWSLTVVSRNVSRKRFTALGRFELFALTACLLASVTEDRSTFLQMLLIMVLLAVDTYENRAPKIAWAASTGGHYDELMVMEPLMAKYDSIIVTEKTTYTSGKLPYRIYFLTQMMRKDKNQFFEMIGNSFRSLWILIKEDPDVVVTTGVLAVIPLCLLMKLNGKKMIYIESFCRVTTPTKTGLLLAKYADETFVQWEELKPYYPKAKYKGGLL